ncbi:MAG: putative beta-lysine N-acetyltransferase, partial [Methanomicrobiales archaeon HGW-Methanomicrobiales-4]
MKNDIVIPIGKSILQHGYFNNRIYLIKIHPDDIDQVIQRISYLQSVYNYSKIFIKIPETLETYFKTSDTIEEARIPGFYQGTIDALFLSRFFDPERSQDDASDQIRKNLLLLQERASSPTGVIKPETMVIRKATAEDISHICSLYQRVFETYPFPIHEPYYIKTILNDGVQFFVGVVSDGIIAAGSCEIDSFASSVEMSDLAVDSAFKGLGISKHLLSFMEQQMREERVRTAFTICRAEPLPVNRLFSGSCYQFGGTLIRNTNICGNFESMNIW